MAGGRTYRQLAVGSFHTCAVSTAYRAFCWGDNQYGQLGIGRTRKTSLWPRRVAGENSIKSVTAGVFHTCAKTTTNRAYCWGYNLDGQLGDGTRNQRLAPTAVLGGMYFSQLDAGAEHTCGRSAGGVAYCWGANAKGTLGDGTTEVRLTPTAVLGPS